MVLGCLDKLCAQRCLKLETLLCLVLKPNYYMCQILFYSTQLLLCLHSCFYADCVRRRSQLFWLSLLVWLVVINLKFDLACSLNVTNDDMCQYAVLLNCLVNKLLSDVIVCASTVNFFWLSFLGHLSLITSISWLGLPTQCYRLILCVYHAALVAQITVLPLILPHSVVSTSTVNLFWLLSLLGFYNFTSWLFLFTQLLHHLPNCIWIYQLWYHTKVQFIYLCPFLRLCVRECHFICMFEVF